MRSIRINWTALLVAALALSFSNLAPAADDKKAADVAGTWEWTTKRRNQDTEMKHAVKIKKEGDKLTGVYVPPRGDEVELKDLKVEGDTITFAVVRTFNNQERTIKYNGKVEGETIKGKSTMTRQDGTEGNARDWEAKKAKA